MAPAERLRRGEFLRRAGGAAIGAGLIHAFGPLARLAEARPEEGKKPEEVTDVVDLPEDYKNFEVDLDDPGVERLFTRRLLRSKRRLP